jgi:hypothetical protein
MRRLPRKHHRGCPASMRAAVNAADRRSEGHRRALRAPGHRMGAIQREIVAFMRYVGQGWEIPVPLPDRAFTDADGADPARGSFPPMPASLAAPSTGWGLEIEIVTFSVKAQDKRPAPDRHADPRAPAAWQRAAIHALSLTRRRARALPTGIITRDSLTAGRPRVRPGGGGRTRNLDRRHLALRCGDAIRRLASAAAQGDRLSPSNPRSRPVKSACRSCGTA